MKLASQVLKGLDEVMSPEPETLRKYQSWQSRMRELGATSFRSSINSRTNHMECFALTNSSMVGRLIQAINLNTNEVLYDSNHPDNQYLGRSILTEDQQTGIVTDDDGDDIKFDNGSGRLISVSKSNVKVLH